MPPADRKNPVRAKSSDSRVSFMEFTREYPDDDACLDFLWRTRYAEDGEHAECPNCEQTRRFKKYATAQRRQSWTCTACGHHIHPTAGTIFHKSSTSLHLWFYAIYLVSSSRCGIAAKQLEREIGVNYKTALRMLHLIREELMCQDDEPLSGEVEVDETYLGGKPRASQTRGMTMPEAVRYALAKKRIVFAAVERGGEVRARVIPNSQTRTLVPATRQYVLPGSMVFTPTTGTHTRLSAGTDTRTAESTTPPASTWTETYTRRRLTASSGTSRPTYAAPTIRSRPAGSPAT